MSIIFFRMRILNILMIPMDTSQHQMFNISLKYKTPEKVNTQATVNFTLAIASILFHHPPWPFTPQL